MGFHKGTISCKPFLITKWPAELDLEKVKHHPIDQKDGLTRQSCGVVPFYHGQENYVIDSDLVLFRVRIDKITPDKGLVEELWLKLIKQAKDRGEVISRKVKKDLKSQAEDDIAKITLPRTVTVECAIQGEILWIGTTSDTNTSTIIYTLLNAGLEVESWTPWAHCCGPKLTEPDDDYITDIGPRQSAWGSWFLQAMIARGEDLAVEPDRGSIKLLTPDACVSLTKDVRNDLDHHLAEGCRILTAKVLRGDDPFTFDGLNWRVSGLGLPKVKPEDSWVDQLAGRLDDLHNFFSWLNERFSSLHSKGLLEVS